MTRKPHRGIPNALRKELVKKFHNQCAICSIDGGEVPLEFVSKISYHHQDDTISEDNYLLLCPNCHRYLDSGPKEIEFQNFLSQVLKESGQYDQVESEVKLGKSLKARADLLLQRKVGSAKEDTIVECKTYRVITRKMRTEIINRLKEYQRLYGKSKLVLAFPGRMPKVIGDEFLAKGVDVWDIDYIFKNYQKEVEKTDRGYFKFLFSVDFGRNKSREHHLIEKLKNCIPGKEEWSIYQSLIAEICEELFSPPLGKPISELSDFTRSNRRDLIFPNYAMDGFWKFMREKYSADYIVIDAKNYNKKVDKKAILQIANYLKAHGAGLFGMIFSRYGCDAAGGTHTLREQWMIHGKMLLVLDDTDVENMLLSIGSGAETEVLGAKIQEFRLSM